MNGLSESAELEKEVLSEIQSHHYPSAAAIAEQWIDSLDSSGAPEAKLATAHYCAGVSYFGAHQMPAAERHLRTAIEIGEDAGNSADATVYYARVQLVETLLDRGSIGELQGILEKAEEYISQHESVPASYLIHFRWARFFWLSNDPRSALDHIDKLTPYLEEVRSQNISTYVAIRCLDADVRLALGKTNVKERLLTLVSEIFSLEEPRQPVVVPVTLDVIRLLRAIHDDADAEKLLRWGLQRVPTPPKGTPDWVYATFKQEEAIQLYNANNFLESERSIRAAIESTTSQNAPLGRANMYEMLGAILLKTQTAREALSSFHSAVTLVSELANPDLNALARLKLDEASCLYWLGEKDNALDLAEQSLNAEDQIYDKLGGNLALTDAQNSIAFLHNFSAANLIFDSGNAVKIAKLVLHRKGRIFANAFPHYDPADFTRQRALRHTQEELSFANQSLSTESAPAKKQEAMAEVRTLIGKVENLESQALRHPQNARIDLQNLLTAVPEHKALIDFISFPRLTERTADAETSQRGSEMLGAVIYIHGEDPQWIVLGNGDDISSDFKRWDETIYKYPRESAIVDALIKLYKAVWEPLAIKIPADVDDVILCTDYPINYVPFACLIDGQGHFLCERYSIRFVQNVSDAAQAKPVSYSLSDRFLGIFESAFSGAPAESLGLTDLKASHQEADAISASFDESRYYPLIDKDAREDRVQALMQRREIIHISTHSVYLPEIARKKQSTTSESDPSVSKNAVVAIAQAAFGTALLLDDGPESADARLHGIRTHDQDDGFFTLAEISALNLRRAKLVALSSCETALAVQLAGEGSVGLERALHAAGVSNVILTLWKIPDDNIPLFFQSYYRNLQSTKSFFGAFVQAQRQTLQTLRQKTAKDAIATVGSLIFSSNSIAD